MSREVSTSVDNLPRLQTTITWDASTRVEKSTEPTATSSSYATTPTIGSSDDMHKPQSPGGNGQSEGANVQFLDVPHPKYMQMQMQNQPNQTTSSLSLDIVSKQRQSASDKGTLRIPSPREYERGRIARRIV